MSGISQTLSVLSNISSFSVRPDTTLEDKNEAITEQFLPRRQDAVFGDQFIFQTTALQRQINAKLVLLPPLRSDVPPFAKSVIYLSSLSGSVTAFMYRLPGADAHFFRLYIFARRADVKVTLPSLFRGVVNVKKLDGLRESGRVHYSRAFRDRMHCGHIRLDSCVPDDDDEVCVHAEGSIKLRLMPLPRNDGENIGCRVGRHVRQIFGTTWL